MLHCADAVLPFPRRAEGTWRQPGLRGWYPLSVLRLGSAGHRASSGAPWHGCHPNNNQYSAPFLICHALLQTSEDYTPRHTREYGNHIRISGFI